jgi:FtsP/CotA-like multicopper oxidase with cupredoxin domain
MRPGTQCLLDLSNELTGLSDCAAKVSHDHSGFACPDTTNMHTHGLHLSGTEDDVSTVVEPGAALRYTYNVPANHLMGTHWFHAHRHGSTAIQLMGGLAGALLVSHDTTGPLGALPADIAALYGTDGLGGTLCVMNHLFFSGGSVGNDAFDLPDLEQVIAATQSADTGAAFATNAAFTDNALKDAYVVNGQYQPTVTLAAGKVTLLRFIHTAGARILSLELAGTGASACTMQLIARDGVFQATPFITTRAVAMFPATRSDIAIRCGAAAVGTTDLVFKAAGTVFSNSFGDQGLQLIHTQDVVMRLAVTAGSGTEGAFPATRPTLPSYLSDLTTATAATFPVVGGTQGTLLLTSDAGRHTINDKAFPGFTAEDRYVYKELCLDSVYEFSAVPPPPPGGAAGDGAGAGSGSAAPVRTLRTMQAAALTSMHPLHIHIDHMQIMKCDDLTSTTGEVIRVGEWRDTVGISAPNGFVFRMKMNDFVWAYGPHARAASAQPPSTLEIACIEIGRTSATDFTHELNQLSVFLVSSLVLFSLKYTLCL